MIRTLELHEIARMEEIGHEFAAEAQYPGGFSLDAFCQVWAPVISSGLGQILVSEETDGSFSGALGMAFVSDGFSGHPVALENFWFVRKPFRATRAGLNLFFGFESAGHAHNVKKFVMVHLVGLGDEKLQKFYESQGYQLREKTFVKVLDT